MSLIKAQDKVDDWVRQHELGYFNPFEILARLAEENGELAREISNKYGSKKKKSSEENKRIKDELGDFLFTLICMANSEEVDLGKALEETIRKYNKRDSERWRKNEKIDPLKYWKFHNMLELKSAGNYSDLREIALDVLQRMPQPVGEVCGPISSGGKGSIEENMKYFNETILKLIQQGYSIFNQMPFEIPMQKLKEKSGLSKEDANRKLLEEFYYPIFDSKLIKIVYFMHNWKTSHGARIERERAIQRNIKIIDLPKNFLESKVSPI